MEEEIALESWMIGEPLSRKEKEKIRKRKNRKEKKVAKRLPIEAPQAVKKSTTCTMGKNDVSGMFQLCVCVVILKFVSISNTTIVITFIVLRVKTSDL